MVTRESRWKRSDVITIAIFIIVQIFSAGILWEKVDYIDRDVQTIKSKLISSPTTVQFQSRGEVYAERNR